MTASPCFRARAFARDTCGGAPIELALGAVMLLGIAALCFDLYSRVGAGTAGVRMAVTMADYVSRDTAPDGDELAALGEFLHVHELGIPADLVYVLTALRRPPGDPPPAIEVLWTDNSIRIGDETATDAIAGNCARYFDEGGTGVLPENFKSGMASGKVLIVAEVCARLRREGSITGRFVAGDIYCFHAVPARDPSEPPSAPVYVSLVDTAIFAHRHSGSSGFGSALVFPGSAAALPGATA
jgi:hypothetical protein